MSSGAGQGHTDELDKIKEEENIQDESAWPLPVPSRSSKVPKARWGGQGQKQQSTLELQKLVTKLEELLHVETTPALSSRVSAGPNFIYRSRKLEKGVVCFSDPKFLEVP